ncbi:hypothetical protein CFR76_17085 [Komagataeibacter swingsii]|uniref:Uncharacterized protein n=1 Tax=Komagataeibacter swingsii TaxID=215220 RepID=A0A2V4RDJ5_9PROT|nr:hypothetical protein CFR76_17085 [Komagataeibacter swingsii]
MCPSKLRVSSGYEKTGKRVRGESSNADRSDIRIRSAKSEAKAYRLSDTGRLFMHIMSGGMKSPGHEDRKMRRTPERGHPGMLVPDTITLSCRPVP